MRHASGRAIVMAHGVQDVIGRGSKVHPLYARIVEARAAKAIVVPAQPAKGLQVPIPPQTWVARL